MTDPLTRLVELTVYAPIGLAAVARDRLPDYVEEGRTRVEQRLTLARFIGQMVVTQGRREVERRLAAPDPAASSRPTSTTAHRATPVTELGDDDPDTEPCPDKPCPEQPVRDEPVRDEPVRDEPVRDEPVPAGDVPDRAPAAAALPIDDYESLAAAQVVARLADLDAESLAGVEAFERSHRNRRTVLNRIGQLRGSA